MGDTMYKYAQRINVLGHEMHLWGYDVCTKGEYILNSLNAKCIYTCILTQPYNHLCDACQCCVYYKESL